MKFFQKRWVRIIGLIPLSIYSFLAILSIYFVVDSTIFRPINQVFPMTDMVGWFAYFFFLSIIGASGILAMITAYFLKGIFKVLHYAGALAIISSLFYLPFSFIFTSQAEFRPVIPNQQYIVGKWRDNSLQLDLSPDNTYRLSFIDDSNREADSLICHGTWRLEREKVHLTDLKFAWKSPWEVTKCDGYYFITYTIPDNFDAWLGYLGLMRERAWLSHH